MLKKYLNFKDYSDGWYIEDIIIKNISTNETYKYENYIFSIDFQILINSFILHKDLLFQDG